MAEDDVDFVVAAYRDEGAWTVVELPPRLGEDFEGFTAALARFPSDVGVLGLASVNDDFFVIVRRSGEHVRALLSDSTAAWDWPIAADVADLVDAPEADEDAVPVGDLDIVSDLGLASVELGLLCDDDDLFPDEALADLADRLGFGDEFEAIVG
ncbi:tRNA adenosine deaminase-associated protein [Aeromicrobium sp. 179-A 4D2 NHS]|uniref:tRNA adenosine deaminase-associated protein n=1 Tax=Aeromicrobium sp. 179-A 4D2 NHS TaxID=3142375 RepID=UPI0039A22761